MKALEFTNLTAGYHGMPVIRDLTVSIEAGDMAGILGPNGAGKTTLLRCATGLCRPITGNIRLFGKELAGISAVERARLVAVVPQELETPIAFTVKELVMIGRTASLNRWKAPGKHDWNVVERAMVYADIANMKDRPITELSGGEKQRAIIAMALAQEPKLILLDEATSYLDLNHRLEVMQIVERLNREQGMTVLMISHDLNLAAEFCPRIMLMDAGAIVADGSPALVLTEENLRRVYRCDVRVHQNQATGSVTVSPAPRLTSGHSGKGIRIHVIAGGGCGEEVLRRLSLCEYTLTCGVLNRGDSDTEIVQALDIPTALEEAFCPVGASATNEAMEQVRHADAVVVCGVPFGPGNLVNLQLAESAMDAGKPVFVMNGVENRDYTPGKQATQKIHRIISCGAKEWRSIPDLLRLLPSADEAGSWDS